MPSTDVSDFFLWVFLLLAAFSFAAWVMKKNTFLGIIIGGALVYAIYDFSGIQLFEILQFFK